MEALFFLVGIPGLIGGCVEYAVCAASRESEHRALWRLLPPGLVSFGAFLSPNLLKEPAEPRGCGMPYLVFFMLVFFCTVGALIGMFFGWRLSAAKDREKDGKEEKKDGETFS